MLEVNGSVTIDATHQDVVALIKAAQVVLRSHFCFLTMRLDFDHVSRNSQRNAAQSHAARRVISARVES